MIADSLDIIGTAESILGYDFSTKHRKWSVGSAFNQLGNDIDLYFCMHDGESVDHACILQDDYPLEEIRAKYDSSYFTCTISYMIAYAMYIGVDEINLIGIDMSIGSEYEFERPSVLYWIGKAEGEGIRVNTTLNSGVFLYGYETSNMLKILQPIENKIKNTRIKIETSEGDIKNQWLGRLHTLKELKNIIRT